MKALLTFNIWQSLYYNPVVILFLIAEMSVAVIHVIEKRKQTVSLYKLKISIQIGFLISWFVFFVIRNFLLVKCGIDMLGDFS